MKKIMVNLLPAIFLWLGSCCITNGQASGDQITDPNQQIIQDKDSSNGKFQPVTVDPNATSNVKLQFPTNDVGNTLSIQPLDGGTASVNTATVDQTGLLTFSFQVTDQPGLYRVIVVDPNATDTAHKIVGLVEFEVPDPAQ